VLNKCDLIHDEALVAPLIERLAGRDLHPLRISGAASLGIDELLIEMFDAVDTARRDDAKKEA
jgi:50S ribosomal subunit-associated GTPase HflX